MSHYYSMEEESKALTNNNISPQQQLRELLIATFRGRSPAYTRQAQATLAQSFQSPGFMDQVASLVMGQEERTSSSTQSTSKKLLLVCSRTTRTTSLKAMARKHPSSSCCMV